MKMKFHASTQEPLVIIAHWSDPDYELSRKHLAETFDPPAQWCEKHPWISAQYLSSQEGGRVNWLVTDSFEEAVSEFYGDSGPTTIWVLPDKVPSSAIRPIFDSTTRELMESADAVMLVRPLTYRAWWA